MSAIIRRALSEKRSLLLEPEAKELCSLYGLPIPRHKVASSLEEAVRAAEDIGFPVVMKIVSKDIIHKSDAGCVLLNVNSKEEVKNAFKTIIDNALKFNPKAEIRGVLVEEMLPKGLEVAVGAFRDAEFGPTVMFGLGGIFIEVLKDVTFRVAPITEDEAYEMIREIKGYSILSGYRGQKPADVDSIVEIITGVSRLIIENEEVNQLDLNPIIVWVRGAKIADARIILKT